MVYSPHSAGYRHQIIGELIAYLEKTARTWKDKGYPFLTMKMDADNWLKMHTLLSNRTRASYFETAYVYTVGRETIKLRV